MKNRSSTRMIAALAAAFLTIAAAFPAPFGGGNAAYAAQANITVDFEQPYAVKGQPLSVLVKGVGDEDLLTYEWTVGGKLQDVSADSYTPKEDDLEKMIRVAVRSAEGKELGSQEMYFSEVPVVYIETENHAEITSKETYLNADMHMQGSERHPDGLYNGKTKIRGRGNATWGNPKKPYKLKLDKASDVFGMGKSKHWVLLANYVDPSLLRNKVSYDFSGAMGMPYMQSVHVAVILNGSYLGNYQFCEQVKLEEGRVNIEGFEDKIKDAAKAVSKAEGVDKDRLEEYMTEHLEWATSDQITFEGTQYTVSDYYGPIDITGGYLLELDYYDDEVSQIITDSGKRVKFKNPEYAVTNDRLYGYVKDYLNAFEAAVYSDDFHTQYEGEDVHYSELFDMESLIQFWLVQELFFNWDGMNNSNFMYKDVGGLMHMGPIWDMDLTSGNGGTGSTTTWQTFGFEHWQHPDHWYRSITKDPYFIVQAQDYYQKIRHTLIEDMLKQVDELDQEIHVAGRANINLWHSGYYTSHVNNFKNWLTSHLEWMDAQFASPEKMIESLGQYPAYGYTPETSIGITAEENDGVIQVEIRAEGTKSVLAYINGKAEKALELENGRASLQVTKDFLTSDGTPNTVQVFRRETDGSVGSSNFAVFESPVPEEPNPDKLDPGNPNPDKPDPGNPDPDKTNPDQPDSGSLGVGQSKKNRLNATSLKLQKGQSAKVLKLSQTAQDGDRVVRWKSSHPQIVKVNAATGKLLGKKTGSAVITAILESGAAVTCKVTVIKKAVATKKITLVKSSILLKKGKTYNIKIKTRMPLTANDKIMFHSANKRVASVSAKGMVTANGRGKTTITVKAASGKKARFTVRVR